MTRPELDPWLLSTAELLSLEHHPIPSRAHLDETSPPDGPRCLVTARRSGARTVLVDLLEARVTAVSGEHEEIDAFLDAATAELTADTRRRVLVVDADLDPPGDGQPFLEREPGSFLVDVADDDNAPGASPAQGRSAVSFEAAIRLLEEERALPAPLPCAVVVTRQAMADAALVDALLEAAAARSLTGVLLGGSWSEATERIELVAERRARATRPNEVEVAVLGPITISGVDVNLQRHPKLIELAIYLAVHEHGAVSRVWSSALWPDREMPLQTISNRLSELRGLLGFAPDNRPRLRREGEHHFLFDVTTDWQRFQLLGDEEATPADWADALALVRGRAFGELRELRWTTVEGFDHAIEDAVSACAHRLAVHLLLKGDHAGSTWACRRGLLAVPWDERLHRDLMRAAASAGDRGELDATLRHLGTVLEIEGDVLEGVHPETARLYRYLSGRALEVAR